MKLTKILIMLPLLSLMMFSCGDGGEDHELVGSWTYTESDSDTIYSENLIFTLSNITVTSAEVCNDDDDLECEDWSCSSIGTWSVAEDQLTVMFPVIEDDADDCEFDDDVVTYNINGNLLTITMVHDYGYGYDEHSHSIEYTRD